MIYFGCIIVYKIEKRLVHLRLFNSTLNIFIFSLLLQVTLGILTVINCKGSLPVDLGVMHQMGAICLISATLYLYFRFVNIQKAG
ncbi:MAG: COX15/CtaA family protein [Saprospiraceae bacterium]|nr:COX15/CtaA family protein [Candidatus Brachybacter algidus]